MTDWVGLLRARKTEDTRESDIPKYEIRMGHEIGDTLEHASGLENECRKCDLGEVHANSARARQCQRCDTESCSLQLVDQGLDDRALGVVSTMTVSICTSHG